MATCLFGRPLRFRARCVLRSTCSVRSATLSHPTHCTTFSLRNGSPRTRRPAFTLRHGCGASARILRSTPRLPTLLSRSGRLTSTRSCCTGASYLTEVVFFHRHSHTALFADLIQNFPRDWFKGWRGVLARLGGIVAPNPSTPRDWRASFLDRGAARAALDRVLAWPIERVLIAHGDLPTEDGAAFVVRPVAETADCAIQAAKGRLAGGH